MYEGYKAIKSMFESILEELNRNGYYHVFAFKDEYIKSKLSSRFLRNIHLSLSEKGVDDRLIAHNSVKKAFKKNYGDIKNIKFRFTDINLPLGLMIVNDKVINLVWGERPTAVEITSKQIAEQYRKFFLEIWRIAKL